MVVLASHFAAVTIKDDERRGAPPAPAARLAERVRRGSVGSTGAEGIGARLPRDGRARPLALRGRTPESRRLPPDAGYPWRDPGMRPERSPSMPGRALIR